MGNGTRSRTPGKDSEKRKLLATLKPTDFPSLIGDILYFSKGHRHVKVMDGPGDGCRDIQSQDKDAIVVLTQCKCFEDPEKTVGSPDAHELIVALTKFGRTRGVLATNGFISTPLKREFTDNFPNLELDWIDGGDVVDEVFSNPTLYRAWVVGNAMEREKVFVKIPFVLRGAADDQPIEIADHDLGDGLVVQGRSSIDHGALETFRPPSSVHWSESLGRVARCASALSQFPPELHATEDLHAKVIAGALNTTDVVTVRFGIPHLVPTKTPEFDKGFRIPGFEPRSYVLRPNKPAMTEKDFLLLRSPEWHWPSRVHALQAEWANWQSADGQRWCHIEINSPSFPNSTQSQVCRMIGESERRHLREADAIFVTAPLEVCDRVQVSCSVEPDVECANGPAGGLLGWKFHNPKTRRVDRETVEKALADEPTVERLSLDDAIHVTALSDDPLAPTPSGEHYDPATLMYDFDHLPSPHYVQGRRCSFVEFWKVPDDVEQARKKLDSMSFSIPDGLTHWIDCKEGPTLKQTFPMIVVGVPCPIAASTNEIVEEASKKAEEAFVAIAAALRSTWPDAECATREFARHEIGLPDVSDKREYPSPVEGDD